MFYQHQHINIAAWEGNAGRGWLLPAVCRAEPHSAHLQSDTPVLQIQELLSQMAIAPALLLRTLSVEVLLLLLSDGELVCSSLSSDADGQPSFYVVTTALGVLPQLRWLNQGNYMCMFLDNLKNKTSVFIVCILKKTQNLHIYLSFSSQAF